MSAANFEIASGDTSRTQGGNARRYTINEVRKVGGHEK